MTRPVTPPFRLELSNQQTEVKVPMRWLKRFAAVALPLARSQALSPNCPLLELTSLEVTLVDDATIARIHGQFLDDPTPTDVITFDHGEVLISAPCAHRQAAAMEHGCTAEIALYLVHAMMHLGGWDDHSAEDAAAMAQAQEEVWRQALAQGAPVP